MASNQLPKNPASFNAWFSTFHKTFTKQYKKHGFTASDLRNFNSVYKAWQQSYASYNSFNAFFNNWSKMNAQQFASFQSFVTAYWNSFQNTGSTTGTASKGTKRTSARSSKPAVKKTIAKKATAKKATAKKATVKKTTAKKAAVKKTTAKKVTVAKKPVAVKKSTASKTSPRSTKGTAKRTVKKAIAKKTTAKKAVKATAPKKAAAKKTVRKSTAKSNSNFAAPFVWLTNGRKSGQVNVWVGASKNGGFHLPKGASSAWVQYRTKGRAWRTLTQGSTFPFVHNFTGNKVWYRACWTSKSGNSSWSKGVTYSISSTKKAA